MKYVDNERPSLDKNISVSDFKNFYWLKDELMRFCRENGIYGSGGKIDLTNRIIVFLETGKISVEEIEKKNLLPRATSPITMETVIGIEYRSYKEKKEFLQSIIGKQFHFTIHLLSFFKSNVGIKTYSDLIDEWYKEQEWKKDPNYKKKIAPQFEYNLYIRDFFRDNPNKSKNDAIKYWKIKKSKPGSNKYSRSDIE